MPACLLVWQWQQNEGYDTEEYDYMGKQMRDDRGLLVESVVQKW